MLLGFAIAAGNAIALGELVGGGRSGLAGRRGVSITDLPGVFLNHFAKFVAEFLFGGVDQFLQLGNRLPDFGQRVGPMVSGAQLGVGRGKRLLVVEIELFVELLPGPRFP